MIEMLWQITKILIFYQGLARNIRKGEILNQAITELKNNYELFEEKSIEEFFYVKKESIKEFSKK